MTKNLLIRFIGTDRFQVGSVIQATLGSTWTTSVAPDWRIEEKELKHRWPNGPPRLAFRPPLLVFTHLRS
jgi:hypothetical protein